MSILGYAASSFLKWDPGKLMEPFYKLGQIRKLDRIRSEQKRVKGK